MKKPQVKKKESKSAQRRAKNRAEQRREKELLQPRNVDRSDAGPKTATEDHQAIELATPVNGERCEASIPTTAGEIDPHRATDALESPRERRPSIAGIKDRSSLPHGEDRRTIRESKLPPARPGPGEPRLVITTTRGRNTAAIRQCLGCEQYFASDGPSQLYCCVSCYMKLKTAGADRP